MGEKEESIVFMEDIYKDFGSVHALRGVDFNIHPGEVVGLIGDNGAGKSTLMNILSGVYSPSKGKIYHFGEEVKIKSVKDAKRIFNLEIVYQDQAVVPDLTVTDNIFLGREISRGPIGLLDSSRMNAEAERLLASLGLHVASTKQEVRFLSGGEVQGVAIARTLYFQADIVALDEPTTALSLKGAAKVGEYIKKLKKGNIACIYITHEIPRVYHCADRFVILSRGRKVRDVSKKEVPRSELEKIIMKAK